MEVRIIEPREEVESTNLPVSDTDVHDSIACFPKVDWKHAQEQDEQEASKEPSGTCNDERLRIVTLRPQRQDQSAHAPFDGAEGIVAMMLAMMGSSDILSDTLGRGAMSPWMIRRMMP